MLIDRLEFSNTDRKKERRDLEEFHFTDREEYVKEIKSFILDDIPVNGSNVLWINGSSKVGVSRLMSEVTKTQSVNEHLRFISVSIDDNGDGGKYALTEMLSQLDDEKHTLKEVMEKFANTVVREISPSNYFSDPALSVIADVLLMGLRTLIYDEGKQEAPYQVICKYIKTAATKNSQKIVLTIDNYHNASGRFLNLMHDVMSELCYSEDIRFVLLSCANEETDRFEESMLSSFALTRISVAPFADSVHFFDVLSDFFDDIAPKDPHVEWLFAECEHNVGELRKRLRNYYLNNGNRLDSIEDFRKYVSSQSQRSCALKVFERPIISIMMALGTKVDLHALITLVNNVCKNVMKFETGIPSIINDNFMEAYFCLVNDGIIVNENNFIFLDDVKVASSGVSADLQTYQIVYDYVLTLSKEAWSTSFPCSNRDEIMSRLSWHAQDPQSWSINMGYAAHLIKRGDYEEARVPIMRFLDCCPERLEQNDELKVLNIAEACYEMGQYATAEKALKLLENCEPYKYRYAFLQAKLENIYHKFDDAEAHLIIAEASTTNGDEKTRAKSMRQLLLTEAPGRSNDARTIFYELYEEIREKEHWSAAECMAMRTKVDYWEPGDDTDEILEKARSESAARHDLLTCSYLDVAIGLQELRKGDNITAYAKFENACDVLAVLRPHEQAYAYNDMGTCKLIEGDIDNAIALFRRASAWGSTPFIKIVLTCNKAVAFALSGRHEDARALVPVMRKEFESGDDKLIFERTGMAICFVLLATKSSSLPSYDIDMVLLSECLSILSQTMPISSARRQRIEWYSKVLPLSGSDFLEECSKKSKMYHQVAFQPWISTLHHD